MVQFEVSYEGDLHCSLTHLPSGAVIATDAPVDNHGKGMAFSPTDLCSVSLGACMITVMGIAANTHNININGIKARVTKEMQSQPIRKIAKLTVDMWLPRSYSEKEFAILQHTALTCPVKQSLASDIEVVLNWHNAE